MLKLNQQILVRNTNVNVNQSFQQLNHQNSYSKIQIASNNRKKSLQHTPQKVHLQTQICFQERERQTSFPDIILNQSQFTRCHTHFNNEKDSKDQEIYCKKLKTMQNQDISPKKISYDACPLQNIIINRKRTCVSENKKELQCQKEQSIKTRSKVPNQLQLFNQDFDQPSNRITFKVSTQLDDEKMILKQIETPGTAQFMQSKKEDNFLFQDDYSNHDISQNENYNFFPQQQVQQRKLSCQEDTFMPVQKTIPTKKPYFQSKKGSDVQISKLECRKIMIILDQEQNRILESVGLNSSEHPNSPRNDELNKLLRNEDQIKQKEETSFVQTQQFKSKLNNIKDENKPYWKLREMSQQKKKR